MEEFRIIVIVVVVFVIRAFGAWMLRIDDVIELHKINHC
jgi:hypothetical protein